MTKLRPFFLLSAISWAILIYFLSDQAGLDIPSLFPGQDKIFHAVVFAVLGFCTLGALGITDDGYSDQHVMLAVLLVMLYGISDEFHQIFVPGRSADPLDILADTAGGALGAAALQILFRVWQRKK